MRGTSCGVCCVYMVAALYDRPVKMSELVAAIPEEEKQDGVTSFETLEKMLVDIGLWATPMSMTMADFESGQCLAIVQVEVEKLKQQHLMLAVATGDTITVASPPDGHASWPPEALSGVWTNRILLISDKPPLELTPTESLPFAAVTLAGAVVVALSILWWCYRRRKSHIVIALPLMLLAACSDTASMTKSESPRQLGLGVAAHVVPKPVRPGVVLKRAFELRNTTPAAIRISRTTKTCGCASASVSRDVVDPGQSVEVEMEVITRGLGGTFKGTVTLWSDIAGRSIESGRVSIEAYVVPEYYLASIPRTIAVGDITDARTSSPVLVRLESWSTGEGNPLPIKVLETSDNVSARRTNVAASSRIDDMKRVTEEQWEVSVRGSVLPGPFSGWMLFSNSRSNLRVSVVGRVVVPWVTLSAYRVMLGRVRPGEGVEKELSVLKSSTELSVESTAEWLTVEYNVDSKRILLRADVPEKAQKVMRGIC